MYIQIDISKILFFFLIGSSEFLTGLHNPTDIQRARQHIHALSCRIDIALPVSDIDEIAENSNDSSIAIQRLFIGQNISQHSFDQTFLRLEQQ